ncbi:hypothetical protein RHOFW104T7_13760 [Rhodanobacter thiooxydans]|uniref:DUF885 domain-containing protein n=1 Tax=Rhodanobacter thiooxydans TaxID=416169 RepID=A0A154QGI0_9GAMM|nr:DUF885 domain-containing protein [Rhodanobacter thiooxydans]EIL98800.1 hypothetical protein UUA_10976 [Rhodanobacter thiooxydans LCS2]KZC23383.1 hypothetical protein RHOFW104T7_13760 [Rhodanobacter thiooxydans]
MRKIPALALAATLTFAGALHAQAAPAAWIERSNADAKVLLDTIARFNPEFASQVGLPGYDSKVADLKPGIDERSRTALVQARDRLGKLLATEQDPNVREDLKIMIETTAQRIEGIDLDRKYLLPYQDVGALVFNGEFVLLKDDVDAARRPAALARLQCYVGKAPGCTPVTEQAKALTTARLGNKALLGPYQGEVEQKLANTPRYVEGIRQLFAKYKLDTPEGNAALDALDAQLKQYDAWVRHTVLPRARTDFRLPEPLYAYRLRQVGIDIPPEQLMKQAELEFMELRGMMQAMAPAVAKAEGIHATDYRDVLKALKQQQLSRDQVEPWYHEVLGHIEDIIRRERIVTLPQRQMQMRVASEAEAAAQPAPHMDPPPFLNNHGERGTFVLTMGNPAANGDKSQAYDDFTFKAAAWTLTAHEGRPGHELQFAAMVERGVSLARSLFAFNSVNVEGWALYAESEMLPYEPPAGQFAALQARLQRAARAYLDPMLNLGLITPERAHQVLVHEVGLSEPMARQEINRYTFRAPGQATAYFYGYLRLQQLRLQTELALGPKFDRLAFNDFVIGQGLLPPEQLAEAVRTQFVPAQRKH